MATIPEPGPTEEEDDYLTMTFEEPDTNTKKETLTQKKRRVAREAEERSRPKSKAELAEEERAKREAALNNPEVDKASKGFKMMAALGYKPGAALGKDLSPNGDSPHDTRLREPISIEMKEDRGGIGADAEKKRKFREEVERKFETEKRQKVDADEFRVRQQHEREEKRREGQFYGAMKVAERLEEEDLNGEDTRKTATSRPLSSYNVLWRGLVKQRLLNERERRMRYDMDQSLSRLPTYDDPDEERSDQIALSRKAQVEEVDFELDQEDEELEEFGALDPEQKRDKVVLFLREHWHYCFWCKARYPDAEMEGCPGTTEEDHD
ncbi:hypothetical protein LTR70_007740 [Exophiala xenobiotica]|uniref:G-patch domain-containing protein n=1 Tax=Lithohypha guttulata TaxID=1690604 RepID=A0ABR0K540_9EURO|nr:hypothetical protein LTR24_006701 [Lithohypha guttulata]KAK5313223.1 hypothetical protein LTR70_007740 [Exophiala xenobiotica]